MHILLYRSEGDEPLAEDSDEEDEADEPQERFSFPDLDAQIRQSIEEYGAVFPKLNFTCPKVCMSISLMRACVAKKIFSHRMLRGCSRPRLR